MTTSPLESGLAAPGMRAIACNRVKVRSCSGLSLAGLFLGGIDDPEMRRPDLTARPFPTKEGRSSRTGSVAPAMAAAKAEAEADPRAIGRSVIIGVIGIGIRPIPVI